MSNAGKIIGLSILAALTAVGVYAGIGVKRLMNLCWNIVKYELRFDLQYVYLNIAIQIKNPLDFDITLHGYDLDVFLNKKQIGKVASKAVKTIPGGGEITINVPAKSPIKKSFGEVGSTNILNLFLRKEFDKIVVSLDGTFTGEILKIKKKLPVEYQINLTEIIKIMDEPSSAPC